MDLNALDERAHVHGLVVFRIHGRRVPSMGFLGPDDVCLDTWLPELLDARTALAHEGGVHVFDEGEQGQPAFRFERHGDNVLLSVDASLLTGVEGDPAWHEVECSHHAFSREVVELAKRLRRDLRAGAPRTADAWWSAHARGLVIDDAPPTKPVLEIDGTRFRDLPGFVAEVSEQIIPSATWGGNLDAFNDILRGGFGTPEGGFVFKWRSALLSRGSLGYAETARVWEERARCCHPSNVEILLARADAARRAEGTTLFEDLLAIIRAHGDGGDEAEDGVDLELDDQPASSDS